MHRRKWDATTNAILVMAGVQGTPGAAIWNEQQLSQAPS